MMFSLRGSFKHLRETIDGSAISAKIESFPGC